MYFIGKIIGAILGLLVFGATPLAVLGVAFGVFLGHKFDKGLAGGFDTVSGPAPDTQALQACFFRSTFSVLGYVAKSDGRVSEAEIAAAEGLMSRMRITGEARQLAIQFFAQGKASDFQFEATLEHFYHICRHQRPLLRMFIEIQVELLLADGDLDANELALLQKMARTLHLSEFELAQLIKLARFSSRFTGRASAGTASHPGQLANAYQVLGVESDASTAEIKRAYRKLMTQHHPDKLVAKGLPEEMLSVAKEKTQEIQVAYDLIIKNKGP